jgi:hypothetical protein
MEHMHKTEGNILRTLLYTNPPHKVMEDERGFVE